MTIFFDKTLKNRGHSRRVLLKQLLFEYHNVEVHTRTDEYYAMVAGLVLQ